MQIEENPYESTLSSIAVSKTLVPHTVSIRAEAWRGVKFGSRITGIVISVIAALVGLGMLGLLIYAIVVTNGAILNEMSYLQIAKVLCGSIFAVLLTSFYGGVAGGIIMMVAAVIRKRRLRVTASNSGSTSGSS